MNKKQLHNKALTHKFCKDCGKLKHAEKDYHKAGKNKDGSQRYKNDCKECRSSKRNKEAKANNKLDQETKYNMHLCLELEPTPMKKVTVEKIIEKHEQDEIDQAHEEEKPNKYLTASILCAIFVTLYFIGKHSF